MMFVDYLFEVMDDGTIMMDQQLKATEIHATPGDLYKLYVTPNGRVVFKKVTDGHSRTDQ